MPNTVYTFHPLADTLPLLEGQEFDDLVASIRENGQRDPISIYKGQIIDGRNRYRACQAAGVKALVEIVDDDATDDELLAFVVDKNIRRRQLTESQRAIAVARLVAYGKLAKNDTTFNTLAAQADVSRRTVVDATAVIERGSSNVVQLVERGEASVSRAAAVVRGKIPEADLVPKPRASCGRPAGNMHIGRLRNLIEAYDTLKTGKVARGETVAGTIVKHWQSDPAAAKKVSEMAVWLRSLARELEEVERVQPSTSAVA